jgi:hypothetical protein
MQDGLKIITLAGGYYGRSIVRIGWLRRITGDEYVLVYPATVLRTGNADYGALDRIAVKGPGDTHKLTDLSDGVEEIHRLLVRRSIPCNAKAWANYCPKPKEAAVATALAEFGIEIRGAA